MPNALRTFFDHSRHILWVRDLTAPVDVLTFTGTEGLSELFSYTIEFTSVVQDIEVEKILGQDARFSIYGPPKPPPFVFPGYPVPEIKPLRVLNGVITGFRRLSSSKDEARYEVTLQPRLALLGRGRQYRIYQHKSVPEIVEHILRTRHGFRGQDFFFDIIREYPRRKQVMQYEESDLTFIMRLLAEVGIWFRFTSDQRLNIDVVEFHDDQRKYIWPSLELPCRPPSGLDSDNKDSVWNLQASHRVVEKSIAFRAYDPRNSTASLTSEVDQSRGTFTASGTVLSNGATTTYGEDYRYGEHYTVLGEKFAQDEKLQSESGFFYARLRHERYLNESTQLSGTSSSAGLALAQVLDISDAPLAFDRRAVVTHLTLTAARDRSLQVTFEGIPYAERICFRPPLLEKKRISGTLPARVTSNRENDPYSHIDMEGRYRVKFLFDRDSWNSGEESVWLRLARPYAGDTHGLHLPLICGTEVAVAFEQGDPDRPYIAHALHDNRHPDHVTLKRRDYKRNVLRTPANNKLRMEDERGEEHIKLSTEHSGKSQLNLGHLVDANKNKRGEGFELRTDGWGAIRGGKGIFITADEQPKAQGDTLSMNAALAQLEDALRLVQTLARSASLSGSLPADEHSQRELKAALNGLKKAGLLASAPDGMALTTGANLQLSATENLTATAGDSADMTVRKSFRVAAGEAISLFAQRLGIKMFAAKGPVEIEAQGDAMRLGANNDLSLDSVKGEIVLNAKNGITLVSGDAYIKIANGCVEIGAPGQVKIKNDNITWGGSSSLAKALKPWKQEDPNYLYPMQGSFRVVDKDTDKPQPFVPYRMTLPDGSVLQGVTNSEGMTERAYGYGADPISLEADPKNENIDDREEEEEEEELVEGITLRIGLFFDGTGNNMANSAATEQCQREDLEAYSQAELKSIADLCSNHGFTRFNGTAFTQTPDNSYGNAPTNVAYLYELYPDNISKPMQEKAQTGYLATYVEGIGTRSGGQDAVMIGQALGRGATGVVGRVKQAPELLKKQLNLFQQFNPGKRIRKIEVDIFGFSRGAAAARHCANEFLKPGCGVFAPLLQAGQTGLLDSFDPAVDVCINLIGLFDTVAAISTPEQGDLSPANASNAGVNLYLPPACARQVIQLVARDEHRFNFALNDVLSHHLQVSLPGAHSDIGGGYLPNTHERLWLTKPVRITLPEGQKPEAHPQWAITVAEADALRASGLTESGKVEAKVWSAPIWPLRDSKEQNYWFAVVLDRTVRHELSLVALRVMRELAVGHGVPFEEINPRDERFTLRSELQPIADEILLQVMAGSAVMLEPAQERFLRAHYIHQSAHWTPTKSLMLNKPAPGKRRIVHPDQPQKGYPQ